MNLSDRALLQAIRNKIPDFDAEQHDGSWIWVFGCDCDEAEEGTDSLIESFIDFAAKYVLANTFSGLTEQKED